VTPACIVISRRDGRYFALDRHATRWVESRDEATQFATIAAVNECILFGRLSRISTGPLWLEGM